MIKKNRQIKEAKVLEIKEKLEKYAAIDAIKRLKLNDYSKIRFVEDYTGYKL